METPAVKASTFCAICGAELAEGTAGWCPRCGAALVADGDGWDIALPAAQPGSRPRDLTIDPPEFGASRSDDGQPDGESSGRTGWLARAGRLGWAARFRTNKGLCLGLIASTIFDSSEIGGMHWSVLKVSARFRELIDPVFSSPDSGYSADNVIPSKVAGAFATLPGGQSVLRWDPVTDLDIDHYEIYASNTVTTSLSGMTLLGKAFSPVYLDNTYLPGSNRFYRVAAVDKDGNIGIPSDVVSVQTTSTQADRELLAAFALEQNYPNPFNPSTLIHYTIPKEAYVSLKVYDLLGREVAVLVHDKKAPGSYAETWDASGMASGVYVCRLRSGDFVQSRRMLLLR